MKKIIISIPGLPWNMGAYSTQAYYLVNLFLQLQYDVFFLPFKTYNTKEKKQHHIKCDLNHLLKNNTEYFNSNQSSCENKFLHNIGIYNKLSYLFFCKNENELGNKISDYNEIITKYNIDYVLIFAELYTFIYDVNFACKSIYLFPNHCEPIDAFHMETLQMFDLVICLTKSTLPLLKNKIVGDTTHIPHIIDFNEIMKNKPKISKSDIKKKYDIPEDHLVMSIIAGNYEDNRKGFDTSLMAFNDFLKKYPDIKLFLYIQAFRINNSGIDILKIIQILDIPYDKIRLCETYISNEEMNELYEITDMLLMGSKTEGFGIPMIEAQIRGIPVITNNFCAMKDNASYGKVCEIEQLYYNQNAGGFVAMPSVKNLVEGIYYVISNLNTEEFKLLRDKTVEYIKDTMSFESVKRQFAETFTTIVKKPREKIINKFLYLIIGNMHETETTKTLQSMHPNVVIKYLNSYEDIYGCLMQTVIQKMKFDYLVVLDGNAKVLFDESLTQFNTQKKNLLCILKIIDNNKKVFPSDDIKSHEELFYNNKINFITSFDYIKNVLRKTTKKELLINIIKLVNNKEMLFSITTTPTLVFY